MAIAFKQIFNLRRCLNSREPVSHISGRKCNVLSSFLGRSTAKNEWGGGFKILKFDCPA